MSEAPRRQPNLASLVPGEPGEANANRDVGIAREDIDPLRKMRVFDERVPYVPCSHSQMPHGIAVDTM